MDAVLQGIEVLPALGIVDHDLAVDDVAARWESELGEVASKRLAAPRLDHLRLAVDEHDRPEAVVLGLIGPLLADRQTGAGAGQLRLYGRLERKVGQGRDATRCAAGTIRY